MDRNDSALGYILSGCIFYVFGLKWCYEYAKYWHSHRDLDHEREPTKLVRASRNCQKLLRRHPLEGTLKLLATAMGLASTLTGNLPNSVETAPSPKVVHATIYLFFALSGLVDVLTFYFPHVVSDGLAKMALAQAFFIEGFLFLWTSQSNNSAIVLARIVWTSSFAVVLELVWPEMKLLRAASTLLHGSWLAHMVRTRVECNFATLVECNLESLKIETLALSFSWHFAASFIVTLCVVAVTRSCAPKLRPDDPPEIPIYDYCHDVDQRV
ncbi:transmembrane protein 45B [Neodiprion pinetum]|uniref:Transmembrane protein 45B n=1 Tax=Neodiprion lecontei TaxID=441921 RepID=A0A6J0BAC1_NEOLC|nr:transmembrane protein 45B [Neodiprion lecontei]XP_046429236.1 transmembrane protein 45B-like [Neodiprion fabricii]XP_046485907.1 transmembrane protein 45B-like [Neodiprion pinetum]